MSGNLEFSKICAKMSRNLEFFTAIKVMRENDFFTDVILVTSEGQKEVKAHKMVLAARSPYFYSMFTGGNYTTLSLILIVRDAISRFFLWCPYGKARRAELKMRAKRASEFYHTYS